MSFRNNIFLAALIVAAPVFVVPALAADDVYPKAAQAMAAKDYRTATLLQSAVDADPDSLRNAARLPGGGQAKPIAAHPKEGSTR